MAYTLKLNHRWAFMLTSKFAIKGAPVQKRLAQAIAVRHKAEKRKEGKKQLDKMHDDWFFSLTPKYFVQLQKEWNEVNLKIVLPNLPNYDAWLNYFKTLSPNKIKVLAVTGQDILSTEAYAALSRWHDIISSPHRIDKIHQSGLTNPKGKDERNIVALALQNDRYGVLCATRDKLAEKLEKGAGTRDTALLVREMTEVMTQIADYEKRSGPKKDTKLGQLLGDMPDASPKRARGKGARNTSFKTRVTIEDVEK